MRILVTGKNGQVGNSLVSQLATLPDVKFLALGRDDLDITDAEHVTKIVSEFKPNIVINAGAYTAVDKAESDIDTAYAVNCLGPKNLALAAAQVNAVMMHISTDYVFAGDKQGLYCETDPVNPQGVYGRTKLEGEQAVAQACPAHIILRTAWVFSEHGNNFVKTMLRLAQTRDVLGVVGDQFGGPTYAGDIAAALISIAHSLNNGGTGYGVYHYSGAPQVSWQQFAVAIFNAAEKQHVITSPITVNAITTADYPTPAKRPANSTLDCSKIKNSFAIEPSNWQGALAAIKQYQ
jgi:dTDP-4-dehydrorhamnose reductase